MSPRPRIGVRAAVVLGVAILPLLVAATLADLPAPVQITLDGRVRFVPQGTTLGGLIRARNLHPRSGRLLDVEGHVLRYRADPGRILLNGAPAPRRTTLESGDAIQVVNGTDRTEGTRTVVTRLKGLRPGNPQFALGTSRVQEIRVEGRVSGIVVSVKFRSIGPSTRPPAVALTFDDGPWPGSTLRILDVLERLHVRATFFVIGYLAQRYPNVVRAEMRAGMTIGNHSWDHPNSPPFDQLAPPRIRTEMARTSRFLHRRFGLRVTLFRPPGGSFGGPVVTIASGLGMRIVQWNVDPKDWIASRSARTIADAVLSHVRPGSIVDLHDGGGDQSATVRALPRIIRGIRAMGLRLVAIGNATRGS
ncbi:MAG TPA: polysaccharide deacetylase family protein [Actinomycetota bacterium]|nr:polysaccharide deacetylase family protein [Actinomycetota bacterium]